MKRYPYLLLMFVFLLLSSGIITAQESSLEANDSSFSPIITGDGNFVFFMSLATNLPSTTEFRPDGGSMFVYERQTGEISQIIIPDSTSTYEGGATLIQPNNDGRFVTFLSWIDVNRMGGGMYLLDRDTGSIEALNVSADGVAGDLGYPYETTGEAITISDDGRFVLFLSRATNILPDDPNEDRSDLYLLDRETNELERVLASTLDEFPVGALYRGIISGDGNYIAYSQWSSQNTQEDSNETIDVFLLDRETGEQTLVSRSLNGTTGNDRSNLMGVSPDGRFVWFNSDATDLVPNDTNESMDIFLFDVENDIIERVNVGESGRELSISTWSPQADITPDGRYVVFQSNSIDVFDDLVGTGDHNLYRLDRETGDIIFVSQTLNGGYSEGGRSSAPSISDDGRYIVFSSDATDLVSDDTNNTDDIFLFDSETGETSRISVPNP